MATKTPGSLRLLHHVWGTPGAPLLPASLREMWSEEPLPQWVLEETQLPRGSTVRDLDQQVWQHMEALGEGLRRFLVRLVAKRAASIANVVAVNADWPRGLDPAGVPWKIRIRNCLYNGLLYDVHSKRRSPMYPRIVNGLDTITFGELFSVRNMGAVSVIDFACSVEGVLAAYGSKVRSPSEKRYHRIDDETDHETDEIDHETEFPQIEQWIVELLDEPWSEQVTPDDPRFADIISPFLGSLADMIQQAVSEPDERQVLVGPGVSLEDVARQAKTEVERIARLPLEEQLKDYLHSLVGFSGPRLDALVGRFGWGGDPPLTLQTAAGIAGVTRERVRQLQKRARKQMPNHPVVMPGLDRAIDVLEEAGPVDVQKAGELLAREKIAGRNFDPDSVLAAAEICGRETDLEVNRVESIGIVSTKSGSAVIGRASRIAIRVIGASGAASVFQVAERARDDGLDVGEDEIRGALEIHPGVEFLEKDWFWMPGVGGVALRGVTRKILSVASPIPVSELREGLVRAFRFRSISGTSATPYFVPPSRILQIYYDRHPEFLVDKTGHVNSVERLDYRQELTDTEQVFVRTLRRSPACVMDRSSFMRECMEEGIKKNTLGVLTVFNPILKHLGTDLWSLRGVSVDPAAVEVLRREKALHPREKRLTDYGWDESGDLWLTILLPPETQTHVYLVPSPIRRFLAGKKFEARTGAGRLCGRITVSNEGYSWGYSDFVDRSGAEEDDVLRVDFNLKTAVAKLRIVTDDVR